MLHSNRENRLMMCSGGRKRDGLSSATAVLSRRVDTFAVWETNYLPISLIGVFLPGIEGTATGAREWTEVRCAAEASIPVWRLR